MIWQVTVRQKLNPGDCACIYATGNGVISCFKFPHDTARVKASVKTTLFEGDVIEYDDESSNDFFDLSVTDGSKEVTVK